MNHHLTSIRLNETPEQFGKRLAEEIIEGVFKVKNAPITVKVVDNSIEIYLVERRLLKLAGEQGVTLLTELSYALNQLGFKVGVTTSEGVN